MTGAWSTTRGLRGLGCIALALAAACGGGESATPTGRTMSAPAQVTARSANRAPSVERLALVPDEPRPGQEIEARVQAVDADGDALRLRFTWTIDGHRAKGRGAALAVPADARKGIPIAVEVVASDGFADSEPAAAGARVGNRPPAMVGVRLQPGDAAKIGQEVVAVAEARDPDDDPIRFRYAWSVDGDAVGDDSERLATDGLKRGEQIQVRVYAHDGSDESEPAESSPLPIANTAPRITSTPSGISADGVLRYGVEAVDPDGDRNLRFSLGEAPEGARIDPVLGELVWTARHDHVGTHPIEVVVQDGHGGETRQKFELTVSEAAEQAAADQQLPASAEE